MVKPYNFYILYGYLYNNWIFIVKHNLKERLQIKDALLVFIKNVMRHKIRWIVIRKKNGRM